MPHWIKISYERNEYVVDLDGISAFAYAPNGKITFWLPNSRLQIIIHQQSDPDGYQKLFNYIQNLNAQTLMASWIRIIYDRCEYVIDLNRLTSFSNSPSGRLTFWLPDSCNPIIINQQSDPDSYQKILDYIKCKTGHSL